jgi:hypothetical protein
MQNGGRRAPSFDDLKALAKERRSATPDLLALIPSNDPYAAGRAHRKSDADWFASVCSTLIIPLGWHLRRIHYVIVSRSELVPWPDGRLYLNTQADWNHLCRASRDAVAMSLVPADILTDRRNAAPLIAARSGSLDARAEIEEAAIFYRPHHHPPRLRLLEVLGQALRPIVERPYLIEIWAEKTTVNDVLHPLARAYGLNVVTASGEISATACRQLVDRAVAERRPVRVLYVSDFDPAGRTMPVSAARKVEFEIDRRGVALDVQVRPVVLTHEQCVEYSLPRTPIKETERRSAKFEERFGVGATELDALEALHPGALQRILTEEIERYWSQDHDRIVDEAGDAFEAQIEAVNEQVAAEFKGELDALTAELRELEVASRRLRPTAENLFARMRERLAALQPTFKRPRINFVGDEDLDPLLDSQRDYFDQLASYKRFQGKSAPEPDDDVDNGPR